MGDVIHPEMPSVRSVYRLSNVLGYGGCGWYTVLYGLYLRGCVLLLGGPPVVVGDLVWGLCYFV